MPRVLLVEDDRTIRNSLGEALSDSGYEVRTAEGVQAARLLLDTEDFDAALMDIRLKDGDGLTLLEEVRRDDPQLPVIMVTAFGDSERTIRAMQAGAFEYVTKPFEMDALLALLARAVRVHPATPVLEAGSGTSLVGASPAMLGVWKSIGRAAASRVPVLITGETGVGKELVARAIHEHAQPGRPFVAVNLASLPSSLVESELFGHEKGSFTGAVARREGRFELASEGTLFLDEIADLELPLQTKLLRVLEDGGYERVGGSGRLLSGARIISATSRSVAPGQAAAGCGTTSTTGWRCCASTCRPCARAGRTSPCSCRPSCAGTGRRRARCRMRRWPASSSTTGRATCGSCATRWRTPARCRPRRSSTRSPSIWGRRGRWQRRRARLRPSGRTWTCATTSRGSSGS